VTVPPLPTASFSSTWAIVPIKPLRQGKTRLAHILSVQQRAELMFTFFQHTLHILSQSAGIDRTLVISSDPAVLAISYEHGAVALDEGEARDLNSAVARAVRAATESQVTAALILPADLPFIQVEDVQRMICRKPRINGSGNDKPSNIAICADDRKEGTNALFISLPTDFTFHYGKGSFQRHQREASNLGLTARIVTSPNLEFDLDTEEDWHRYQRISIEEHPYAPLTRRNPHRV
jgi:2-phospho-L-lactate guanylyltransferase